MHLSRLFAALPFLGIIITLAASDARADAASDAAQDPPDPTRDSAIQTRRALSASSTKLRAALAADTRVAPLTKELLEAVKMTDRRQRAAKLQALGPRVLAIRSDALKKAALDVKAVETQTSSIRTTSLIPPITQPAPAPGSLISSANVSSFPSPFTFKFDCPDSSDKHDFDGNQVKIWAQSTPVDKDCWKIRAGRMATVQVPAGAKKIEVVFDGKVDLDVVAMSLGAYAKAVGDFGIKVRAPSGAQLDTVNVPGQSQPQPVPVRWCRLKRIEATSAVVGPVPVATDGYAADLQEGDANSKCTMTLPDNVGGTLELTPYTGGWVDADLSGVATLNQLITIRKLKTTFYR